MTASVRLSFATGWGRCLAGLATVLAGEPLPPADRGVARHEQLVRESDSTDQS